MACVVFHLLESVLCVSVFLLKLPCSDFPPPSKADLRCKILSPSFTCVTLGRLLSLSEPHIPHFRRGYKMPPDYHEDQTGGVLMVAFAMVTSLLTPGRDKALSDCSSLGNLNSASECQRSTRRGAVRDAHCPRSLPSCTRPPNPLNKLFQFPARPLPMKAAM